MKILIVKFGKQKGTTERLFYDYCKILASANYNISTLSYNDDEIEDFIPSQIPKFYIKNYGKWDPVAGWKIKNMVRTIAPDIIVAHGSRAANLMNKFCSFLPIAVVCHNPTIKSLSNAKNILVPSDNIRDSLIEKGMDPDNIYKCLEPIFLPDYNCKELGDNFINKKTLTIGTISRLKIRNGHKTFLKAISILRNRGVKINVLIASVGPEELMLRKVADDLLIGDIVTFTGWVDDKNSFFNSIDILCVPTLSGSLAHSIIEGFASNLPVVAYDIDCYQGVAKANENILLVQDGEAGNLAQAIEQLNLDRKLALKLAKNGRDYVIRNCQPNFLAKQIYTVLHSIAGEGAFT